MSIPEKVPPRERMFDPSKFPLEDRARQLVASFAALVQSKEKRQRARRGVDKERFNAALAALVLDLAHWRLKEPKGWLYVSMTKADYAPKTRRAPFLTETFPALVHMLGKSRLLQVRLGTKATGFVEGRQTSFRAGKALRLLIDEADLLFGDIGRSLELQGDPLRLRAVDGGDNAPELPIPNSEQASRLREEMLLINRWLNEANVQWVPWEPNEKDPDTGYRFVRRGFRGTLDHCGRLSGGFWTNMSKVRRLSSLYINDVPCAELDYGQIGVRIAYSKVGVQPPPGDLYAIPGLERYRGGVKTLLNALLSKDGPSTRFPPNTADLFPGFRFADVYQLIAEYHPALVPMFGTRFYLIEQRIESDILLTVIHRMRALGIHGFPAHDCLLVSIDDREQVKTIMEDVAYEALGLPVPVDVMIDSGYSHMLDPAPPTTVEDFPLVGSVTAVSTGEPAASNTIGTLSVPHRKGA